MAPATETLRALPATEHIDLAFIDADKPGYQSYWDELVPRAEQTVHAHLLKLVDEGLVSGSGDDVATANWRSRSARSRR